MNEVIKNKIETFFSEFAPFQFEKDEIIIRPDLAFPEF